MAAERVGDMTMEEPEQTVNRIVNARIREDERINRLLKPLPDNRSLQQLFDDIDRHRFTPPPGSPSTLELLREDWDR